jgi:hypothetical protein
MRVRRLGILTIVAAIGMATLVVGLGVRGSTALFGDQETTASTFSSGVWGIYYLHNIPTPPTGNTNRQANLPLDASAPTATTLYNYDANGDAFPGRLVDKGGAGAGESDLVKYQNWRSQPLSQPLVIAGTVNLELWSAIKDFGQGKAGSVMVFLRDFNPATSTYTEISNATLTVSNWQGTSNTWVNKTVAISVSNYTVQAGRQLEVKIIVGASAGDSMWFAYDTVSYQTRLVLP